MDNGDEILSDLLDKQAEVEAVQAVGRAMHNRVPTAPDDDDEERKQDKDNHTQWAIGGNGKYIPVGATEQRLPAGIYEPFASPGMWGVEKINVASDGIYKLPDMATEQVLDEAQKFWTSEQKYRDHNLLYKRGVILWGPPGGGKTVTVKILMNDLVSKDGIVIVAQTINLTVMVLKAIRRIEPKRNLIVVMEDIDEIINANGESVVLSMLDGENNVDNIFHLATTNYPERLGARIINRPSRFDRRVFVGMPADAARRMYLDKTTKGSLSPENLEQWVKDSNEMSIAHLRELVAAVYCLDQPYDVVIKRLKKMAIQVKGKDEFKRTKFGFAGTGQSTEDLEENGDESCGF